ncbi:collagen alpha-4(VI) chain [Elysia marginata]|uniref:Collagen alpha-4(VI) chain n=1 Tax=Elysia marginata TaxID=1093978 RepID=A0AAV4HPV6_9GAST|nr:collagen alpha-4(VI) chain [Elysia marginata]
MMRQVLDVSLQVTTISAVMSPSAGDLLSGQYTTQLTVAPAGITVRAPTTPASSSGSGYCFYKNVRYQHGETWEDGCLYNCVTTISAVMSPSAGDLLSGQYTTQLTVAPAGITVRAPTTPASSSGSGYCFYKNVRYQHGETWEDGCLYNCVCEDGATGSYRCIEKCETFVNLPDVCHLETDPTNPCCKRPVCVFVAGHDEIRGNKSSTLAPAPPTPVSPTMNPPIKSSTLIPPTGVSTTLAPPTIAPPTQIPTHGTVPEMCMYEGRLYTEGQTWYDACDFKCTCVDGLTNSYTCLTRCPQYPGDFSACSQVADPEDPQCCSVPSCPGLVIPPGQFAGTGTVPARGCRSL